MRLRAVAQGGGVRLPLARNRQQPGNQTDRIEQQYNRREEPRPVSSRTNGTT